MYWTVLCEVEQCCAFAARALWKGGVRLLGARHYGAIIQFGGRTHRETRIRCIAVGSSRFGLFNQYLVLFAEFIPLVLVQYVGNCYWFHLDFSFFITIVSHKVRKEIENLNNFSDFCDG